MTKYSEKEISKFTQSVIESVALHLLAHDELSEAELSNKKLIFEKAIDFTKDENFDLLIDYRELILETAKYFLTQKKYEFSIIFFAMFYEHSINNLIAMQLSRKNITNKAKNDLIRSVNIAGKFSWLLEILELPEFNKKHKNNILNICNERNAFIHYKWNPPQHSSKGSESTINQLIDDAMKAATYFKKYISRALYSGKKGRLNNALK